LIFNPIYFLSGGNNYSVLKARQMAKVLIIDDDELFSGALQEALGGGGMEIHCCSRLLQGLMFVRVEDFDVVFLDVMLPDGNGLAYLEEIRGCGSQPEVIILTGAGTADSAELAIECGAWDYIQKPSSIGAMRFQLARALQYREEKGKTRRNSLHIEGIAGSSRKMKDCLEVIAEVAATDVTVLITGETGTGKELFAHAIHRNSNRAGKNFIVVDCAALQENLTESVLFGHEKGAFTGAAQSHKGLIKHADEGTLFLDEIGELPLNMQKVFLRVLQERRFRPLGASREESSEFRLIAATNRNLNEMAEAGLFRKDLLYRLDGHNIKLPSLREHKEDMVEIAIHHTAKICRRSGIDIKKLSPDFVDALLAYDWPGNVRELVHALERAIASALSSPTIFRRHLPTTIRVRLAQQTLGAGTPAPDDLSPQGDFRGCPKLKDVREAAYAEIEKKYLRNLLEMTAGNIDQACSLSALSRRRLYELLKKHSISTKN